MWRSTSLPPEENTTMIRIENTALKPQTRPNIAIEKALSLLDKHAVKTSGRIISFKECRRILGWLYHFNKQETERFLFEVKELGLIERKSYHGIRIGKTSNCKEV